MKKDDLKTLLIFIVLILLIGSIFIYNLYINRKRENVDRKIEYIFDKYTYSLVLNEGNNLFFNTINIISNKNFDYEKNSDNTIKYYSINDYNHYKKILNYTIFTNILSSTEIEKYMKDKKIINRNSNYYIENYTEDINEDYIGSIIEITSYDDNYVYFESTNYYCENEEYQGLLKSEPDCNYSYTTTNFTVILENNFFKIDSYENIAKIIQ